MDPLSLSTSIAGLISITDMIAGRSYKYIKEARGASKEVQKLVEEITDLFGILNSLRLVASRYQDEDFDSTMQSQHIYTCHMLLEKIKVRLDKADPSQVDESKSPFRQRASSLGRTLIWPFSSAETKGLIAEVAKQRATLSLALAADGMNALIESLSQQKAQGEDIAEIRDNIRAQRAEQAMSLLSDERRKILDAIGSFDPSGHQNIAIRLRQPGTGVWFTEGPQFKHWLETPNAKLWLYGIPGAGKTVLMSSIVHATMNQCESTDGIAYFYCDYKDSRTQEPMIILGTLVRQLVIQNSRSFGALEKFYSVYYSESGPRTGLPATPEDLCLLIQSLSGYFDEVMIIIDALDECGNDRSYVVELLVSLNSNDSNIKTLFTSRLETDIELHLASYEKISIAATSSDLKLYVASEIESRSRKKLLRTRDPDLKKEIMDQLVGGAEGMFRWVTCQLDYLCELNTDKGIRKALKSLPPTLFATYERILDRVNASNADTQLLVQRVLTWIVCSKVPLSTEQLLEALSISEGDIKLDNDAMPDEEGILKWCSSLVRRTPDGKRLELAHFTVEEFLLAIDSSEPNSPYTRYKICVEDQDLPLAKLCLTYLLFDNFQDNQLEDQEDFDLFLEKYSFYGYASSFWAEHSIANREDEELLDLLKILFDPAKTGNFLCWSRCWVQTLSPSTRAELNNTETLHFAAALSLHNICEWLIDEKGRTCDLDKLSSIGTPLYCVITANNLFNVPQWSSSREFISEYSESIVTVEIREWTLECLLDAGAKMDNVKVHPGLDMTPLSLALRMDFGWTTLLSRGAILDEDCFEVVEELGRRKFAREFLVEVSEKNLDEKVRSKYVNLALDLPSTREQAVTMMSKASGVSSEISAEASSALAKAAAAGQTRVVRELLNRPEVDMNFRVPELEGQTALHRASLNGHLEIVELLLKHGALLEVTDDKGITPLLGAAGAGELIVFKVLEKSGGDVNAVAEDGQTVLHIAAAGDSLSVLNHLALSSKLIHTLSNRTKDGRTALLCAVQDSSLDTAYSIFHKSSRSEILSKTNDGHTCLHYAVLSGNLRMIALFQDVGICYHDQTTEGFTALHYAAIEGNFETNEIQTLIFCAILDHIDDVTLTAQDIFACPNLIDTRAHLQFPDGTWVIDDFISGRRIDIPTNSGKTVLQLLVSETPFPYVNADLIEDLVSRGGIDLERRDREKKTPLIVLASRLSASGDRGCREAICHLLDRGADPNASDILGRTALHYLCDSTIYSTQIYQTITEILELDLAQALAHALPPLPPPLAPRPNLEIKRGHARPLGPIPPLIASPRNWPSGHLRRHSSVAHNLLPTSINKPKAPPNRLRATRVDICDLKGETALQIFFKSVNKYQNTSHATDVAIGMLRMTTKAELDRQFPDGSRFFCLAIAMKNDRLIKELYKLGVDTQCRDVTPDVRSPLELFCINGVRGDVEILRELIKACKDLAERDIKGMGLIHLASNRGHLTVVKELVDGGLDINHRASDGGTALLYSVGAGHTSIVDYLLENGARIDESRTEKLYWMSSIVSRISNVATCRLLEDRGINDWNEQTECQLFFAQFIPGLSATRTEASETSTWISPILRRLTPIHHYALRGFVDVLRYVVEHHTDVNIDAEAEFGIRPLFLAILGKRISTARYLIERGANLDGLYKPTQWTMLHLAAHIGELEIVTTLLEHGADPWARDKSGLTPSVIALQQDWKDIFSKLEEAEQSKLSDINKQSTVIRKDKISPALSDAIQKGDLKLCQQLIGRAFSIDGTCRCGCTALLKACVQGRNEIAEYLLRMGASVDGVACSRETYVPGFSLLHIAAMDGEMELFKEILKRHPVAPENAVKSIHVAARKGRLEILQFLIEGAKDKRSLLAARTPKNKEYDDLEGFGTLFSYLGQASPLHIAAKFARHEAADYLLHAGSDLEARDEKGQTPLHTAFTKHDNNNMFGLLIKAGASLNARDNEGVTPLMLAAEFNQLEVIRELISMIPMGLDLHAIDMDGRTALHHAVEYGQVKNAKLLIEAGLNPMKLDFFERNTVTLALYDNDELYLLENLPDVDTLRSRIQGSHLNIASFMGQEPVVKELLKRAPEQGIHEYVNLPCNPGTPLYSAALRGHIPIMEQLVKKGADINLVGGPFGSPLMVACTNGRFEAVTWLLRKGAEVQCIKLDGTIITAEEAAQQHESVSSLLRRFKEHGAEALDEEVPVSTADISKLDEFMIEYKERKQKEAKEEDAKDNWKNKREKGEARDEIGRESDGSGSDSNYSGSES